MSDDSPSGTPGGGQARPRIIRLARITDRVDEEAAIEPAPAPAASVGVRTDAESAGALADEELMQAALAEARLAASIDEVPVGAVVAANGRIVARAHNLRESTADPTAHAEILALRAAAARLGTWRLDGLTLVVTLEPCFMCAGALVNARVERLVFGAPDPKAGAVGSLHDVARDARLNHRLEVTSGVLAAECGAVLKAFFAAKRGLP